MADFPMPRGTCPFDQHPGYVEAARQGPLTKVSMAYGQIVWFVTGYAETRALFADPRLSVDRTNPSYPGSAAATPEQLASMRETQSFNQLDDPEHAAYRRLAIPSLTVRRVKELRPALQSAVDGILDGLLAAGSSADLVPALAVPLPSIMFSLLYDIPAEDRPYFEERVQQAATDRRFGGRALSELSSYLDELLLVRDGDGPDLLSGLMSGRRTDLVTQRRVLNLALQTLVAGNESTLSMLAMGTLSLLAHRNQWEALAADPARVPAAVEELLRYLSVADSVPRVALADVEIGGEVIRTGDGVLLATPAANRDARTFPDPDRLDITRPARSDAGQPDADRLDAGRAARHHIAFGYGVHQCVGQNLARATLEIAIGTLVTRIPSLRLAVPADEVLIDGGVGVHRITRLPVTWDER